MSRYFFPNQWENITEVDKKKGFYKLHISELFFMIVIINISIEPVSVLSLFLQSHAKKRLLYMTKRTLVLFNAIQQRDIATNCQSHRVAVQI